MIEGHGESCYYCGEKCNSLAANPGRWPIPLCHADEPGVVKWHHVDCVSDRLVERDVAVARAETSEAGLRAVLKAAWSETRKKNDLSNELKASLALVEDLKSKLAAVHAHADDVWFWQGDGYDHPESLTCPVVMRAETLREFVKAKEERDALREEVKEVRGFLEVSERFLDETSKARDALAAKVERLRAVADAARVLVNWGDPMGHGDECAHRYCEGDGDCDDEPEECEAPGEACTCSRGAEDKLRSAVKALDASGPV